MARYLKLNTPEKRARIGERIKVAATQSGLSLKELAEAVETTPSYIYQYVRGITAIPPDLLQKIAAATKVHPDFFDPELDARSALALPADAPPGAAVAAGLIRPEAGTRARIEAELKHLLELSQAQTQPKRDRAAYVSNVEHMLALARMVENKQQEGWILWKLGNIRHEENTPEVARQHLEAARELFGAENMTDYRLQSSYDLARVCLEQGAFEAASAVLQEGASSTNAQAKWRAHQLLCAVHFEQQDFEGAIKHLLRFAQALEQTDPEDRETEGIPALLETVAQIAGATGHLEEAVELGNRRLQSAVSLRQSDKFLESVMLLAQYLLATGRLGEARQKMETAVVMAGFLSDEEGSLGIARARLSAVLTKMGALEEGRDNARQALRIAHKTRASRATIISALAMAENSLAREQWQDALDYAEEALEEADRTGQKVQAGQAHEVRARGYLKQAGDGGSSGAQAATKAVGEAGLALKIAEKAKNVPDQIAARLTLARAHVLQGNDESAGKEVTAALQLIQEGAVPLSRLLGRELGDVSALLKSPDLDLKALFAGKNVETPLLEWQARYLQGTLLAKQKDGDGAYGELRAAAEDVAKPIATLTQAESSRFQQQNPEVAALFASLKENARTGDQQKETRRLMANLAMTDE